MRSLILFALAVAIVIALIAVIWPRGFQNLSATEIGWATALVAMGAVGVLRLSTRRPDGVDKGESIRSALQPRPLQSATHGVVFALIWVTILLALVAAYSLTDWADRIGHILNALFS